MTRRWLIATGILVAILLGLYFNGTFDRPLSSIGLNFHECARNGLGATFCGHELDEYRARVQRVKEAAREAGQHAKETVEQAGVKAKEEQETTAANSRAQEEASLREKMAAEKRIIETEPETSIASAEAKGVYEADRAQLQQLQVGGP